MKLKKPEKSELFVRYPGFWRDLGYFFCLSFSLGFFYVYGPKLNDWILNDLFGIKNSPIAIIQPILLYVVILGLLYHVLGFCNNKKNLFWCIVGTSAFVACVICLELFQGVPGSGYYYDIVYAGISIVIISWWGAALLYSLLRFHAAKILAIIAFLVVGGILYEWLAAKGVFSFPNDRFSRPLLVIETVLGVIKRKDLADVDSRLAPFLFYAFHGIMAFFGGYIVVGMVSKATANALLLLSMKKKPDCVMWDSSPESLAMAKDLREHGKLCIFVQNDLDFENEKATETLIKDNFLWVLKEWGASQRILQKIPAHFFLSPDSSKNVEKAAQLSKMVQKEIDVYVRIEDESDDSWLFRWADGEEIRKKFNIHIIRETSVVANLLLREHPMFNAPGVECSKLLTKKKEDKSCEINLLLIGFGSQGRMILNRTICDSMAPGAKFSADVVSNIQASVDMYKVRCPDIEREYNINFDTIKFRSEAFFNWLKEQLSKDHTRIIVATEKDDFNLKVADFIIKFFREKGDIKKVEKLRDILFVHIRYPEKIPALSELNEKDKYKEVKFTEFGSVKFIYSDDNIVNSKLDRDAIFINAFWSCKGDVPTNIEVEEAWRNASCFNRESSRASAMGVNNLWRLAGVKDMNLEEWSQHLFDHKNLLNNLAEAEHLRWMAFERCCGVRRWDMNLQKDYLNIDPEGNIKANMSKITNSHAAIADFSELPKITMQIEIINWRRTKNRWAKLLQKCKADKEICETLNDFCTRYLSCIEDKVRTLLSKNNGELKMEDFNNDSSLLAFNKWIYIVRDGMLCLRGIISIDLEKNMEIVKEFLSALKNFAVSADAAKSIIIDDQIDELQTTVKGLKNLFKDEKDFKSAINKIDEYIKSLNEEFEKKICYKLKNRGYDWRFKTFERLVENDFDIVCKVPNYRTKSVTDQLQNNK